MTKNLLLNKSSNKNADFQLNFVQGNISSLKETIEEELKTKSPYVRLVRGFSYKIEKIPFQAENSSDSISNYNVRNSSRGNNPSNSKNNIDSNKSNKLFSSNFSNFHSEKYLLVKDSDNQIIIDYNPNEPKNKNSNSKNFSAVKIADKNKSDDFQIMTERTKDNKSAIFAEEDIYYYDNLNDDINKNKKANKENILNKKLLDIYNINFSNNLIDLSNLNSKLVNNINNNNLGKADDIEMLSAYFKDNAENFLCEEFKITGKNLSALTINNLSYFLTKNNSIKFLDLSETALGDVGCRQLSHALETNKNLSEINLQRNFIGDIGAAVLAESLQANEKISKIELEHNVIGNKGAEKLFKAIQVNFKVKWLNLFGNISISSNIVSKISLQLKNNRISSRTKKPFIKYPES